MTFVYNSYTASVVERGESLISLPKESFNMILQTFLLFLWVFEKDSLKYTLTSMAIKLAATIPILHSSSSQKGPLHISRKTEWAF